MLSKIASTGCDADAALSIIATIACAPHPVHDPPPVATARASLSAGGGSAGSGGDPAASSSAEIGSPEGGGDDEPESGYVHPQGTELQAVPPALEGFAIDATRGWSLRGAALGPITVVDGALVAGARRGADLTGATFAATLVDGRALAMRIARVVPYRDRRDGPPPQPGQSDYVLEYADGDRWSRVCPPDAPAAMPVVGSFGHAPDGHSNGDHDPSPTRLTFACRAGVAHKCQSWGYRSWRPDEVPYFQACTRMARADYCGNGHSRTVDHTPINYIDLHGQPLDSLHLLPGFVPEAVWGRGNGKAPAALCVARSRWATIPIGPRSPCADVLADPRDAGTGGPHHFCDDMTVAEWAAAGALFADNSIELDIPVTVWGDGRGHYASTTQFPWLGPDVRSDNPPGYPVFVSIEGAALKRSVGIVLPRTAVPLFRYTRRVGALTLELLTTGPPHDGFGNPVLEAYALAFEPGSPPPTSTARPLYLHSDGRGHFVTTSEEQSPPGYRKRRQIAWLPH